MALALPAAASAQGVVGRWDAVAELNGAKIPFRLDVTGQGDQVHAVFFDGDRPVNPSKSGTFRDGALTLSFPSYASTFSAKLQAGALDGTYNYGGQAEIPIHAVRHAAGSAPGRAAPSIAGDWIIPIKSPKGETAWRLIVRQAGGHARAAILRVDGDTGTLSGDYAGGRFELSHFTGERPSLLEVTPQQDKSLKLELVDGSGHRDLIAVRPRVAEDQKLGAPTDPAYHTSIRDASEPLRFRFPDLGGREVADTDARFRGKVVLINIMGSWCPNCHDEAPFLQSLYSRYHARGLEIVALDFEQPDQLQSLARLHAFIDRYKISYTVLVAGQPKELNAKLPQAVNLNAWPTTFFVGRDGKVKAVHVGFTSPGSAQHDAELRRELTQQIEALLAARGATVRG